MMLKGGMAAAPRQLNNKNREEPENYWATLDRCDYVVTLRDGEKHVDQLGKQGSGVAGGSCVCLYRTAGW